MMTAKIQNHQTLQLVENYKEVNGDCSILGGG